ncbi:MAG: hypothetical protein WCF04_05420 [Candidatus Nanopelagicales bacterium]
MSQDMGTATDPRTADVYTVLDELSDIMEVARAMPMSDKCVVNRNEVLDLLDALRQMMPTAVQEAEELLADRVGVVEDGYREAERAITEAQAQAAQLVAAHHVTQAAVAEAEAIRAEVQAEVESLRAHSQAEAEGLVAQARAEADQLRREVDQYVEGKFASFEATLSKTLAAVQRGRDRIRERYGTSSGADGYEG